MSRRETHRRWPILGLVALLLMGGTSARAGYLSETGAIQVISPPPSVALGALTSNTVIQTFVEQPGLVLSSAVAVDDTASGTFTSNSSLVGGTIAAGTAVQSYFFHSDLTNPTSTGLIYNGTVTFTTAILGVIVLSGSLDATDAQLGYSGTTYPTGTTGRGLELGASQDFFTLSADMRTLTLNFDTHLNVDEVRVLTAVPEPASAALMGFGMLTLAGVSCRRKARMPA